MDPKPATLALLVSLGLITGASVGGCTTPPGVASSTGSSRGALSTPSSCFSTDMRSEIAATNGEGFAFIENQPPPWSGSSTPYGAYPATQYTSADVAELSLGDPTANGPLEDYWLWANRCVPMDGITKPGTENPTLSCPAGAARTADRPNWTRHQLPIIDEATGDVVFDGAGAPGLLRPMFSSLEKANVCTVLQARRVISNASESAILALGETFGLHVLEAPSKPWYNPSSGITTLSELPADAQKVYDPSASLQQTVTVNGVAYTYLVDVCIVEETAVWTGDGSFGGIVLDYEVGDLRPEAAVTWLFDELKKVLAASATSTIHPALTVFTDDLSSVDSSTGTQPNGITGANFHDVLTHLDYLAPILWTQASPGNYTGLARRAYQTSIAGDYEAQVAVMNEASPLSAAEWGKLMFAVGYYYDDCSSVPNQCDPVTMLADYGAFRSAFMKNAPAGLLPFRSSSQFIGNAACDAAVDGIAVNQITACLAFNQCDGTYE